MLADPQTVNALSHARVPGPPTGGAFAVADGSSKLTVNHSYGKVNRRVIRLDNKKLVADVYNPADYVDAAMEVHLVIGTPKQGYTVTEQKDQVLALCTFLSASSAANLIKIIAGES